MRILAPLSAPSPRSPRPFLSLRSPCSRPTPSGRPLASAAEAALLVCTAVFACGPEGARAQAEAAPPAETPAPASPDTADAPSADAQDGLGLNQIVITGTSVAGTKMKQSVSISTLTAEQISATVPTNAAEILRAIPGVRSESSGGEGNANLTVRGVPISAGGARYVQFQEDGLPILLFGDIAFGTADEFLRADANLDRLEVVRGGSASTLATNSPGGIVNFIGKTGEEAGGSVSLDAGLDYRSNRVDFDYGAPLGGKLRVHFGGFYRRGEGARDTDFDAEKGGQFKANATYDLGDDSYLRASVKFLDDRTPTLLPVPVETVDGHIHKIPGIDPRTAFFISDHFPQDPVLNHDGRFISTDPEDGLRVRSNAFGLEGSFDLGAGFRLDDKFRKADNGGRFIGLFPGDNGNAAGGFTGVLFNTSLDSLDNTFNDLKLSKALAVGDAGTATVSAGLFYGKQDVAETWFWNSYDLEASGDTPQVIGLVADGTQTFGGCCARTWDVSYKTWAPYVAATLALGDWNLDASFRHDRQTASGYTLLDDGVPAPDTRWDPASRQDVDYKVSHNSYSGGANYSVSRDLAVFARTSRGVSFSADRLLYGNPLDGSVPIAVNEVRQTEAGFKWRNGGFSSFVTAFTARTDESNYEVTTQTFTSNRYKADGAELELGYRWGELRIQGGATYTHAEIRDAQDPTIIGNRPRRQALWVYQVAPSYAIGDVELGGAVIGTTSSWGDDADTIRLPGFAVVNAFANYRFRPDIRLSLAANNLFDKTGYTEVEGDGHAARSVNGRTVRLNLQYLF